MKYSQYYVQRVHMLQPKNQFQSAVYAESRHWEQYVVDSVTDFHAFVQRRVEQMHQKFPRCGAIRVSGAIEISDRVQRIDIGEIVHMHLHPVQGRWDKRGKFQLYLAMEGGEQL